ncbi:MULTISPECIES: tripartite tricarboxylate transporter TctB family protein [Micromonospora]|uniref:Tripartite tricarboxylate transporter TctB family protein n=1 Tax=Micromonospora solifontis TaxID=2487138 RepID=A0ABX9WIU7_9ACTN|nr:MULTISPECIES: tripartite tricarboxylate transporter TctB family protein [Micromonospora]NES17202.1 tripartite tricarboxylate transporter TctB family protein [Micromonospora sp. PPF5-17B]NES36099.1 tripartite tricarboxylate transporter TctB family protein [Micromonospora solifontis]NES54659.1 tripartite tricarboxylate transporter TctB family protein [Micromonospora sp. PPF5-6]RNM00015.1 tripartite tricarboxylate transporter TctB family protein [Micromonospora solifontis]
MSGRTTRPDRGGDQPSRPPAVPEIPAQPAPAAAPAATAGAERAEPGTPDGPAAAPDETDAADAGAEPAPKPDRAQYGVCAFLALVGGLVIFDATTRIGSAINTADPIGPKPVPILLGVLLLVIAAIYAVDVARGGAGEPEAGEDVDLTLPIDWRTVLLLIGAFLVNAVLIDRLGWVISGTILFWGSAYALGNRHYVRNLLIAVALSLITFYTFAIGLGVDLPAGVLQGIL